MKLTLVNADRKIVIDGVPVKLNMEPWLMLGLDEHLSVIHFDGVSGEIEWCVNTETGRKPENTKFVAGMWCSYFSQLDVDRAMKAYEEVKKA